MRRRYMAVLAAAVAGVAFAVFSTSDASEPQAGKKGSNVQDAPKDVKESSEGKFIKDLELAHSLVHYGRREKNAEAILLGAQIIHKTPVRVLEAHSALDGDKTKIAAGKHGMDPKELVAEAKKFATNHEAEMMVASTEKILQEQVRGAVKGPAVGAYTLPPGRSLLFDPIDFRANELAVVHVDLGGINGRMVLEVIDQNGNVVKRDNVPGNFYRCEWVPAWEGPFRFRLTNTDTITLKIGMATN